MTLKQTLRMKWWLILSAACLVLVFGAGSVSAQSICDGGNFCDGDDDTFIRDHGRCRDCLGERDCDDDHRDPTNTCGGGTSVTYTAELTGAFVFADNGGVMNMSSNSGGDQLVSTDPLMRMWRPPVSDLLPQETWDNAFQEGCPELGVPFVAGFASSFDSWSIHGPGDAARISLTTLIPDVDGEVWEIWLQLIGEEQPGVPFLPPVDGDLSVSHPLGTVWVWGKPASNKGRKSLCTGDGHQPLHPVESVLTITAVVQ